MSACDWEVGWESKCLHCDPELAYINAAVGNTSCRTSWKWARKAPSADEGPYRHRLPVLISGISEFTHSRIHRLGYTGDGNEDLHRIYTELVPSYHKYVSLENHKPINNVDNRLINQVPELLTTIPRFKSTIRYLSVHRNFNAPCHNFRFSSISTHRASARIREVVGGRKIRGKRLVGSLGERRREREPQVDWHGTPMAYIGAWFMPGLCLIWPDFTNVIGKRAAHPKTPY